MANIKKMFTGLFGGLVLVMFLLMAGSFMALSHESMDENSNLTGSEYQDEYNSASDHTEFTLGFFGILAVIMGLGVFIVMVRASVP